MADYTLLKGLPSLRDRLIAVGKQEPKGIVALQRAEDEAAAGDLTKDRVTELFNPTLKRVGAVAIERISIANWLEDWLASKEQLSAATRLGYEQTVREFLEYLSPRGRERRLEAISEADIRGFVAKLRAEGRARLRLISWCESS
jgi:hypothetical protein